MYKLNDLHSAGRHLFAITPIIREQMELYAVVRLNNSKGEILHTYLERKMAERKLHELLQEATKNVSLRSIKSLEYVEII
jgi:hypothetical protein